jgi:hypothetical protein
MKTEQVDLVVKENLIRRQQNRFFPYLILLRPLQVFANGMHIMPTARSGFILTFYWEDQLAEVFESISLVLQIIWGFLNFCVKWI